MSCSRIRFAACFLALSVFAGNVTHAAAQAARSSSEYPDSHIDIYGGYGWWHPFNNSAIQGYKFQDVRNLNATASVTYYFGRFLGVQAEGSYFSGNGEHEIYHHCFNANCDQIVYTAEAGPVMRFPMGRFVPFLHMLGGGERTNGPVDQPLKWGWGVTGGGGIDYILPFFSKHLAVRPIQADYQYSEVDYGGPPAIAAISVIKLSGGIVYRTGASVPATPLTMGCETEPAAVFAGVPVRATASTLGLDPKRKATFTWTANGGRLQPEDSTATIDTTGLAPGEYTVSAHLSQGPKAHQQAECTAPFTIKQILPPAVSCQATPANAVSGTTIDITTTATSPSNRPLSYTYTTTAGEITNSGATARLTTAGLGATTITVTCNVSDDLNQRASATATVTISNPVVPVIPETQKMCSISFARDRKRPVRVDNEAKACLDDIALTLTQQSDAHLVMIGNTDPDEPPTAAAERVLNARQYLTQEKGIETSRIEARVGQTSGRSVDNVLVPSGASFVDTNTQEFDEHAIVRHGEAYGVAHGTSTPPPMRHRRRPASHRATQRKHTTPPTVTGDLNIAPVPTPQPSAPQSPGKPVTTIPPLQ